MLLDETIANSPQSVGDSNANDELGVTNPFPAFGSLIGFAKGSEGGLFSDNSSVGADQPGHESFSLVLDFGQGDSTHLKDLQTNQDILLKTDGSGNILGYFHDAGGDHISFVIKVDFDDGDVRVYQYRAIEHNNPNDPDEHGTSGTSAPEILNDGLVYLQVTVTDEDGDKATDKIDIGQVIKFEDDGPKIDAKLIRDVTSSTMRPRVSTRPTMTSTARQSSTAEL